MGIFSKIKEGLNKTRKAFTDNVTSILNSFTKIVSISIIMSLVDRLKILF